VRVVGPILCQRKAKDGASTLVMIAANCRSLAIPQYGIARDDNSQDCYETKGSFDSGAASGDACAQDDRFEEVTLTRDVASRRRGEA
jgi:hypothetical protein